MTIQRFGGIERMTIFAKAGENIIKTHTPVSAVSYVSITTKAPATLTITSGADVEHRQTKRDRDFGGYKTEKSAICTVIGVGDTGTITSVVFDEDTEAVFEYRG